MTTKLAISVLTILNGISFAAYGVDKWKAMHQRWRIPEATLLLLAAGGGSLGAWAGIKIWHHKTQHKKFTFGVPMLLLLQIAAVVAWIVLR